MGKTKKVAPEAEEAPEAAPEAAPEVKVTLNPICTPLASRKLSKKLYKCVKKGEKHSLKSSYIKRGTGCFSAAASVEFLQRRRQKSDHFKTFLPIRTL